MIGLIAAVGETSTPSIVDVLTAALAVGAFAALVRWHAS